MFKSSKSNGEKNQWNSQIFLTVSKYLAQGYQPGLHPDTSEGKTDAWTTDKLINMSRYLSSAYGVDY